MNEGYDPLDLNERNVKNKGVVQKNIFILSGIINGGKNQGCSATVFFKVCRLATCDVHSPDKRGIALGKENKPYNIL